MAKSKKTGRKKGRRNRSIHTERFIFYSPFEEGRTWWCRKKNKDTGKILRIRLDAETVTDANNEISALVVEQQEREGKPSDPKIKRIRIRESFQEWFDTETNDMRLSTRSDLKLLCTVRNEKEGLYIRSFEKILSEGSPLEYVDQITYKHINNLLKKEWSDLKGRTKIKHYRYLNTIFTYFKNCHYIDKNPLEDFKTPKLWSKQMRAGRETGKALTFEECQKLLHACKTPFSKKLKADTRKWEQLFAPPEHLFLAVLIGLRAGLRANNIKMLTWNHIDWKERKFKFKASEMKGGNKFSIFIHPELYYHLRNLLEKRDEELGHRPKPDERVLHITDNFRTSFNSALKRAGIKDKVRIHDMRHTFASQLAVHAPHAILKALLGHAIANVTDIYTQHVQDKDLKENLEKLNWFEPEMKEAKRSSAI